ncbi:MAG TPA: ABC transporter ATP-binding protein [Alphaproteobacteria bacterium]|jgi:branched-chain amino acid transport system ATP-binding protein
MALLELRNVESYYGPVAALKGISLDVAEGSVVAVLGANGAGKTSLLKTISGALDPEAGTIRFAGAEIQGRQSWDVAAAGIAHVPEGREVFRHLSVLDNLKMGGFLRRGGDGVAEGLARIFAYFPALRARAVEMAGNLSGGEQQMLAIGRALMARPKLILLDEPSLGLSPLLVQEIYRIVRRLKGESGAAMLLVEQNAKMALDVADFGYVLEGGRIVLEGTAERLKSNEDVKEFYLGIRDAGVRGVRRWKRKKQWR